MFLIVVKLFLFRALLQLAWASDHTLPVFTNLYYGYRLYQYHGLNKSSMTVTATINNHTRALFDVV